MNLIAKQPRATLLLTFVHMWNEFSFYGMRALLVLFMVNVLKYEDAHAFGIYAVFCCLVEFGGIFGALLAEKVLGLRRSILVGGWIMMLGHLSLAFEGFFLGLALIIVGSNLFSTNVTALMGHFYHENDERRSKGFTIFYMCTNIGALLATVLCGYFAERFGWTYGFGLAAIGMFLGNTVLFKLRRLLEGRGEAPENVSLKRKHLVLPFLIIGGALATLALFSYEIALPILPWIGGAMILTIFRGLWKDRVFDRTLIKKLALYILALVLFYATEDQISSSLIVFADRMSTHNVLGFPINSTAILALNPIVIILFGGIASALYLRIKPVIFLRIALPFFITALAFAGLMFGSGQKPTSNIMGVVAAISFAELLIGPTIYTVCSEISSKKKDPKIMALIPIGSSLSATLAGGFSMMIAKTEYRSGFTTLSFILLVGGIVLGGLLSLSLRKRPVLSENEIGSP